MLAEERRQAAVECVSPRRRRVAQGGTGSLPVRLAAEPNDWMNGLELREMMQIGLILRGNAYALVKRNGRGQPIALIPWNPDHANQWDRRRRLDLLPFQSAEPARDRDPARFPIPVPAEDVLPHPWLLAQWVVGHVANRAGPRSCRAGSVAGTAGRALDGQGAKPSAC